MRATLAFNGLMTEKKLRQLQVCSLGVARVVSESEDITDIKGNEHTKFHHNEDSESFQEMSDKNMSILLLSLYL